MGKEKNHVKFTAEKNKGKLTVVGFNKGFLNQNLLPFVKELYVLYQLILEECIYSSRNACWD